MRTTYFLVLDFEHRWHVGLMKSNIVKVKSFYNYLNHYFHRIFNFLGHPIVKCTVAYTGQVTFYKVPEKNGHVIIWSGCMNAEQSRRLLGEVKHPTTRREMSRHLSG